MNNIEEYYFTKKELENIEVIIKFISKYKYVLAT